MEAAVSLLKVFKNVLDYWEGRQPGGLWQPCISFRVISFIDKIRARQPLSLIKEKASVGQTSRDSWISVMHVKVENSSIV